MTKTKLPWDIKQECLWIVRGYDRRVKLYHQQRQDIIDESPASYTTYIHTETVKDPKTGRETQKREQRRTYLPHSPNVGRPTEDKQARLEIIENYPETKKMKAVEHGKLLIGLDLKSEETRQRLTRSIILNCMNGREYPFEHLNLPEFSRMDFYRRRDGFLYEIAIFLHMV